jgi:hypothetical protein
VVLNHLLEFQLAQIMQFDTLLCRCSKCIGVLDVTNLVERRFCAEIVDALRCGIVCDVSGD